MAVRFRQPAIKFLKKSNHEEIEKIRESIKSIAIAVEEPGIIPFTELDIKRMRGDWKGYYRLRVGKNRIIFTVDFNSKDIIIYTIGSRGDIYK